MVLKCSCKDPRAYRWEPKACTVDAVASSKKDGKAYCLFCLNYCCDPYFHPAFEDHSSGPTHSSLNLRLGWYPLKL